MSNQSSYQKHDNHDDTADHVGIAEYEVMSRVVCAFLEEHDDVRISLARHCNRGGWFVLCTSGTGIGRVQDDLPASCTAEQMGQAIERLYGRLGMADKATAREMKKRIAKHTDEQFDDWEEW